MKKIVLMLLVFMTSLFAEGRVVGGSCGGYDVNIEKAVVVSIESIGNSRSKVILKRKNIEDELWYVTNKYSDIISTKLAKEIGFEKNKEYQLKVETSRGGSCTPFMISLLNYPNLHLRFIPREKWKPLTFRPNYPNSAFTLRSDVDYFELRKYVFSRETDKQLSPNYIPYLQIYRKKLSSYSKKIVDSFKKVPFNNKVKTDIFTRSLHSPYFKYKVKGFIIKNDNVFWTINEKKDLIWLFDKIDTEAELYWLFEVNNLIGQRNTKNSYRKTSTGYDLKQVQIEHKFKKETKNGHDIYRTYEEHKNYIYHIRSNGVISRVFLSTTIENEKKEEVPSEFHGDPIFSIPLPLEEILKDKHFITP